MTVRPIQYVPALLLVALVAAISILPKETSTPLIVASLILFHLAVIGAVWGTRFGVVSALVAFLGFDYFFLEPYYQVSVSGFLELAVLLVFLLVTVVISQSFASDRVVHMSDQEARLLRVILGNVPPSHKPDPGTPAGRGRE